jgi:glycolate oxidase FAD binding subunit
MTWGGAKVVKSVTGYDVPKLLVGALGTVGVVVEATLRLHLVPELQRTWLLTGPSLEMMQACLDRVADSPLVPDRLELCDTVALAAAGVGDSKAALVVSFGSVADAVAEQGARLVEIARHAGAAATERPMDLWEEIERATTPQRGDIVLEIATLPARIAVAMRAVGREVGALGASVRCALTARGTVGTIHAVITGAAPTTIAPGIARLREAVADVDGHVVVRRAPHELRATVDPWGPVDPEVFALMRRVRQEFDARGVLNPGRFVGRL